MRSLIPHPFQNPGCSVDQTDATFPPTPSVGHLLINLLSDMTCQTRHQIKRQPLAHPTVTPSTCAANWQAREHALHGRLIDNLLTGTI